MDLKRLKHLVALADTRNFGRAATQCHLSQPAFSRSIQAAEEELGLQLFDRGPLEATCTNAGAFVVERARKLVFDSHCLERDVGLYRERLMGDVAFGVGPYPTAAILPQLLQTMRNQFPEVKVRVEVNNADYLLEHLHSEELDFYVADMRNVPDAADITIRAIGHMHASFFVRAGHPLLAKGKLKPPDLLPFGIASVSAPESVRLQMGALMGLARGGKLPLALECDDLHLLKTVTMTTDTVLACADAGAAAEVAAGQLVKLTVAGLPALFADMGLVSLKGRSFSPMAQFSADYIANLATQLEVAVSKS